MFGYVKDRAIGAAASAVVEVLRRKGHTVNGTVSLSPESVSRLMHDLPSSARRPIEAYLAEGCEIEFTVRIPPREKS